MQSSTGRFSLQTSIPNRELPEVLGQRSGMIDVRRNGCGQGRNLSDVRNGLLKAPPLTKVSNDEF